VFYAVSQYSLYVCLHNYVNYVNRIIVAPNLCIKHTQVQNTTQYKSLKTWHSTFVEENTVVIDSIQNRSRIMEAEKNEQLRAHDQ